MGSPLRIVSLVPSLTELVFWLGRGDAVVGRTRFCVEPAGLVDHVPIVGGTKNPKVDRIVGLAPDLVIVNKEENRVEDVEALKDGGVQVLVTDLVTVADALSLFRELGVVLLAEERAASLAEECEAALQEGENRRRPRVCVPIWKNPWMALGEESFGHDLLTQCGFDNVLWGHPRYPEVTPAELEALHPDLVLLPDEPYPFDLANSAELAGVGPRREIDGRLLWWYGPRLPAAIRELKKLAAELV